MDIDPGDGPGVTDDDLSPSDHLLLEYVRAGMPDAEIAVRLGLPTGEVKARISRLVAVLGSSDREELKAVATAGDDTSKLTPGVRPAARRLSWTTGALIAALASGVGIGFALSHDSGGDLNIDADGPETPLPAVSPTATAAHTVRTTSAFGFDADDTGQLFADRDYGGDPVASVSVRATLTVVTLNRPAVIRQTTDVVRWDRRMPAGNNGVSLVGGLRGRMIAVDIFSADDDTQFILGDDDSIAVFSASGRQPRLLVFAREHSGWRWLQVAVDKSGRLLVSRDPVPPGAVIDERTGELLEPAGAQRLGALPPPEGNYQFVWCEEGVCWVGRGGGRLTAPTDGRLTCRADGILELDAGDFRLRFDKVIMGVGKREPSECTPPPSPQVRRGEEIATDGQYIITAVSSSGEPLSVAVALDGTIYVGKFAPTVGCPCRGRT